MMSGPFDHEYWRTKLAHAEAERDATGRWRWLKRSNQLEGIRTIRKILIHEQRVEIRELEAELEELRRKLREEN